MNRRSLVLVILMLAACRPKPWREQARGMAAFGKALLHTVPAAPPPAVTPPPVAIDHRVDLSANTTPAPAPTPKAKQPPPSTKRPPVSTPTPTPRATFAAHARTQAGKNSCSAHPTMEQCTSHCTSVLRSSSLDRSPSAVRSCNCVESGC